MQSLEELHKRAKGTAMDRAGIRFTRYDAQGAHATMPVEGNTQPHGILHGGASALLAESVASTAAQVWAGPGRRAVGVDLSITHMRSVREGKVFATAKALHLGGTSAVYEIEICDESGRMTAHARLTCRALDIRK